MNRKIKEVEIVTEDITSAINSCRAEILNVVEQEAGNSERWEFLRKRILTSFGDRGLTGRVLRIVTDKNNDEGDVL